MHNAKVQTVTVLPPELTAESKLSQIIADARKAQREWYAQGVQKRMQRVSNLRDVVHAHLDDIVAVMRAGGKPELEILSQEVIVVERVLKHSLELASELVEQWTKKDALLKLFFTGKKLGVRREPFGVIGAISAWNGPFQFTFGDAIPALLIGNVVISKPSEKTPVELVDLMRRIVQEAGLSEALYIIDGAREEGEFLVKHCDGIMFTGSRKVGNVIEEAVIQRRRAERRRIPCVVEAGGVDAAIVFPDCNRSRVINGVVWGRFDNTGQNCNAVKHVLYVGSAGEAEAFAREVARKAQNLRFGEDIGPVVDRDHHSLLQKQLTRMLAQGAKCLCPENVTEWLYGQASSPRSELFFPPTVLFSEKYDLNLEFCCEEAFGPILTVFPVSSEEEAVSIINRSPYGLSTSAWTSDEERAERLIRDLDVGNVQINDALANYAVVEIPFGGRRASGMGSRHGLEGFLKFSQPKSVLIAPKRAATKELYWFPYGHKIKKLFRFLAGKL